MGNKIFAVSQDPIHIGTGGYTIGRVDNTIVRDACSQIPKIPGTSIAGTWRYYMALTLHSYFREEYKCDRGARAGEPLESIFKCGAKPWIKAFEGNRFAAIKCAGQDDMPNVSIRESQDAAINEDAGHCGNCLVCMAFGFSKRDISRQGLVYFSDLNILLFPTYTRFGTRWITAPSMIANAADYNSDLNVEYMMNDGQQLECDQVVVFGGNYTTINLGWLNLRVVESSKFNSNLVSCLDNLLRNSLKGSGLAKEKLVIVSDDMVANIIKSNLEVRTSVSIDPLTGAAKEKALFTSEAIPRGTIFYGNIRIAEEPLKQEGNENQEFILEGLKESKKYFEILGIGGMTTRGFGRLKIFDWSEEDDRTKS
jgi:CRISPR-associated protein Cmr4